MPRSQSRATGRSLTRAAVILTGLALLAAIAGAAPGASAQQYGTAAPAAPASTGWSPPKLETDGPWDSKIRVEVFDRLRGEFVDWFATPYNSATPNFRYNFIANKFQLGVRVTRQPYELFVQFQDTALGNVPENAVGVGGTYFANTHARTQNGAFLRNGWVSTTQLAGVDGLFLKGGRQLFSDALEAPVKNPDLKWIQVNRFSQRLIGPFDYTNVGRSFDGGQVGWNSPKLNVTAFGFVPTYGGFEVDANRELDIDLAGLSLNLPDSPELGVTFGRLVWLLYHDFRDVVYVDNRPLPARQAAKGKSATLQTFGANVAHIEELGPGAVDGMAYGYGQFGDYQGQDDGAWAYGVELGYRLRDVWARPWMRVGINSASGDPDPTDDKHQTFFQMLPTAWLYAQFPFYNMMNNQDVFVQWILDPDPRVSFRLDLHWLRVSSARDLVYFGGGATKNDFFGYGGVPADGRYELAYLVHTMLTVRPTSYFTVNGFYAHAWGQGVINQNFTGTPGNYGFLEGILSF